MKTITLKRITDNKKIVQGVLVYDNLAFAVTLELPDLNNKNSISCIPHGKYECFRRYSPSRKYEVFELKDVPGRTHVQIHMGNLRRHSKGCIIVGEQFDYLEGKPAVLSSKKGFDELMSMLRGEDKFILNIEWKL